MAFRYSKRSLRNLKGIHPDLRKVFDRAIQVTVVDYVVTDGLRTLAEQKVLYRKGKSKTLRSRHLTGHAVDIAAYNSKGDIDWNDWDLYVSIANTVKSVGTEMGVPIEWGGDWTSIIDGPHFQLPWKEYPIGKT